MNIPTDLKYTTNDEWLRVEGGFGYVGVTDHAQEALSDIVFVEITLAAGEEANQGDTCAAVESVKAAADVYLPASGKVVEINATLPDAPETINSDPYGAAWMVKIELTNPAELDGLLDAAAYEKHLAEKE
ncbi:MAG: glycine cleavage system protein GcvH [Chloroflexi bacterium]|nr:glycine cleavage system protein GcvH [Chloroflexota bacterium]